MRLIGVLYLVAAAAWGQPARSFEVASVKVHEGPMRVIGVSVSGTRLEAQAETVRGLLMWAYNLKNFQVVTTGPVYNAVGDTFYDIVAKAEGESIPTKAEFQEMLKVLLAERFKLKVHRENREMPVFALVLGKNGPKFQASQPDALAQGNLHVNGRNYEYSNPKASMSDIAGAVANSFPDRPVVDKTGLTGTYDIKLTYTPAIRSNQDDPSLGDINIFAAVQEQLGLKMEPQKDLVEVLVLDHVEKPGGN